MIRAGIVILILACLLTNLSRGAVISPLILPEPEEIYEAFQEGLIDYDQYQALLEISRIGRLDNTDSIYITNFYNLLIGFSPNPIFEAEVDTILSESLMVLAANDQITASMLYRQYQKLAVKDERKRLFRVKSTTGRLEFYGEFETEYSGLKKWGRRNLAYSSSLSDYEVDINVGSFREKFGIGLIYGYHGQLLDKEDNPDELERLLFPRYGGSNGIIVEAANQNSHYQIVFDTDRNGRHAKRFFGLSFTLPFAGRTPIISKAYGSLKNRCNGRKIDAFYMSLYDRISHRVGNFQYEVALALHEGNVSSAASSSLRRRSDKFTIQLSVWRYDRKFPCWFSGGLSSRRYQTIYEEVIDLSYRDRFAGETGGMAKTTTKIPGNLSLLTTTGYYWRSIGDNRVDGRTGIKSSFGNRYSAGIDLYWRIDNIDFGNRIQKRFQFQVVRRSGFLRTRAVVGYRDDNYPDLNSFLVYVENRIKEKYGVLKLFFKMDRLEPGNLQNNYLYFSVSHHADLSRKLSSYIKYSYRYRRGEPDNNYGVLRWDFNYAIM